MAVPQIRMFTNSYVAFYRPRKRLYFCLKYVPAAEVWEPFSLAMLAEGAQATLHKSTIHNQTPVTICLRTSPQTDRIRERLLLTATSLYLNIPLRDGTTLTAPIVDRGMAMQGKYVVQEIGATQGIPYEAATRLWQNPDPPAPRPAASLVPKTKLTPIPKRIAWLVAEEAQKQGETCPITLEPITPLTASVTTCFHCFDAEQLNVWLVTRTTTPVCPMCKKEFVATKAFDA